MALLGKSVEVEGWCSPGMEGRTDTAGSPEVVTWRPMESQRTESPALASSLNPFWKNK